MDMTRSAQAAAAKLAQAVPQPGTDMRDDLRHLERIGAAAPGEASHKSSGYGLPCSNCHLYYPANLDICPTCKNTERVSPSVVPVIPKSQLAAEPVPDAAVVDQEGKLSCRSSS